MVREGFDGLTVGYAFWRACVAGVSLVIATVLFTLAGQIDRFDGWMLVAWGLAGAALPFVILAVAECWQLLLYGFAAYRLEQRSETKWVMNELEDPPPSYPAVLPAAAPVVEAARIVPYVGSRKLTDGVPDEDLAFFIDGAFGVRGWESRAWDGVQLPSGQTVKGWAAWRRLVNPLVKVGAVTVDARSGTYCGLPDAESCKRAVGLL